MGYYLGVDGGGTKTHCLIASEQGDIVGEGFGGPCNYQICGIEVAIESLDQAINQALSQGKLSRDDLSYGVFGLSGADEAIDFEILTPTCQKLLPKAVIQVVNDTWIGLRTGGAYGIVSICGTGAGFAGKDALGNQCILRNLDYQLGNRGGGGEILDEAMHYAFRSEEGTYMKSALEQMILNVFGCKTMDAVTELVRNQGIPKAVAYQIPILTMKHSDEGDRVAREIIENQGQNLGRYAVAVGRKLRLESEAVPMVLIGSVFKSENPVLIEAFMKEVEKTIPKAYYVVPKKAPVYGALQLAREMKH